MIKKLMLSLILLEGVLFAILLSVVSCNQKRAEPDPGDTLPLITMEKTVCFGTCPVYQIRIFANGLADYSGEMHVSKIGHYRRQLSPEIIAGLIRSFEQADFWSLQDEYIDDVTDLPTTYLSFQYKGRHKKVKDLIHAPQHLTDLENLIGTIADAEGWVKVAS